MIYTKYSARIIFYVQKFTNKVKIAENKGLYRVAGLIRTATKRSMRTRPGPSVAPKPPHAHTTPEQGLRAIKFDVNSQTTRAIIGPIKFPGSGYFDEPATYIQEFGGIFRSRRAVAKYPSRSYMYSTVKRLAERGKIAKEFSVGIGEII